MKILDFLSLIHRYVSKYANEIATLVLFILSLLIIVFSFQSCSCSSEKHLYTKEDMDNAFLSGAYSICVSFDEVFEKCGIFNYGDSIHIKGFEAWKYNYNTFIKK